MKTLLLACILMLYGCTKTHTPVPGNPQADSIPPTSTIASKPERDTVQWVKLALNDSTTIEYTKVGYSIFERWFNKMDPKKMLHPDEAWKDLISLKEYRGYSDEFSSEVGQDGFYMLYAYFLQKVNGVKKYDKERLALFSAYRNMNHLKGYYEYGGTYYGHMHDRIYGYTEYSIYILDKNLNSKTDISKEKKAFITMLKKVFADELKEDGNTLQSKKPERLSKMMAIIDDMEAQIINAYILEEVEKFYADYYDYWM